MTTAVAVVSLDQRVASDALTPKDWSIPFKRGFGDY